MSKKSIAERRQAQAAKPGARGGAAINQASHRRSQRYRRQTKSGSQRPWGLFAAIGGVVALFVVVILIFDLTSSPIQDTQVLPVSASVLNTITHIPASELSDVGAGSLPTLPKTIPASFKAVKLTSNSLPEVLYVGAEYCPYCAYTRWALLVALSRFGTTSNLHMIRSSVTDTAGPNIATFSFAHGFKYTSKYFVFTPRELQSNHPTSAGGYAVFQPLNKAEAKTYESIDGGTGYPFVDFGGKTAVVGMSQAAPGPLVGLDWSQIAHDLTQKNSTQAQMVLGGANDYTAAICQITKGKPASVCSSSVIKTQETKI
jgi:hypothetical protein